MRKKNKQRNNIENNIDNNIDNNVENNIPYDEVGKVVTKRAKASLKKKLVAIFLTLILFLSSGGLILAKTMGYDIVSPSDGSSDKEARFNMKEGLAGSTKLADTVNILVFGIDKNEERSKTATIFRPDTIMLVSINTKDKTIKIFSIPRDSRVDIAYTNGRDKINSAFYYACTNKLNASEMKDQDKVNEVGIKGLKQTVSKALGGINIDYYVGMDMDVLPKIGDVLGGVTINVHQNLYAKNGHDRSSIVIKQGTQVLNGKQLLYYSRYRMYDMGDIGRVDIQQKIVKAIFNEFKKKKSFSKITQIYSLVSDKLITDMPIGQIASLGYSFKDFNTDDLKSYKMPGNFGNYNGVSFWIVNQAQRTALIKKVFGIDAQTLTQDPLRR